MLMLPPRVWRDPDIREHTEMFDLLNLADLARYNSLLAENRRTIRILSEKPWPKAGEAATEFTSGTDDAYYLIVRYERRPDSPYLPQLGPDATQTFDADFSEIPIVPPEAEIEPPEPGDVTIDISAAQRRPKKKTPRKTTSKPTSRKRVKPQ